MNLSQPAPMLGVSDMGRAIAFYRDALDYAVAGRFEPEGELVWASLCRGRSEIMLTKEGREKESAHTAGAARSASLYFYVDDVVGLHAEVARRGFTPGKLMVRFYKMKEFELVDPEGYLLIFGQGTDEPPTPEELES